MSVSVCVCVCVCTPDSVMRITVFHQAVCDVADLQSFLVELLLQSSVDCPAHHLHPSLGPVLHIIPGGGDEGRQGNHKES